MFELVCEEGLADRRCFAVKDNFDIHNAVNIVDNDEGVSLGCLHVDVVYLDINPSQHIHTDEAGDRWQVAEQLGLVLRCRLYLDLVLVSQVAPGAGEGDPVEYGVRPVHPHGKLTLSQLGQRGGGGDVDVAAGHGAEVSVQLEQPVGDQRVLLGEDWHAVSTIEEFGAFVGDVRGEYDHPRLEP